METAPDSSRRSSWLRRRSRPAAMREATCSVGLVSPRSTWLSIGAETPERSARSRSDRSIASRNAFTRGPIVVAWAVAIRPYVITYGVLARSARGVVRLGRTPDRALARDQAVAAAMAEEVEAPADHDQQPVLEADQVEEVDHEPRPPCHEAAQLQAPHV